MYKAIGFKNVGAGRVFFSTENSPQFDENKKIPFTGLIADGTWRTFLIKPEQTSGGRDYWFGGGAVTGLRIDFVPGDCEITLRAIEPGVSTEAAWRRKMRDLGVPAVVPVQLGHTPPKSPEKTAFDSGQPYYKSRMAAPAGHVKEQGSCFIRRDFVLPDAPVKQALWQLVTDDRVEKLWINGRMIVQDFQWDWKKSDVADVTSLLRPGKNTAAVQYCNDGDVGGVMFDLSVVFADGRYQLITADESRGVFGQAPENWFAPEFDGAQLPAAAVFPGPPNPPWRGVRPGYRSIEPLRGKFAVEELKNDGGVISAVLAMDSPIALDEICYIRLTKPDGRLLAVQRGRIAEFQPRRLDGGRLLITFRPFDLPRYGAAFDLPMTIGVAGRGSTPENALRFRLPDRPHPDKPVTLETCRTPNGVIAKLDGRPFYFNMLTINHLTRATGQEGPESPFNIVAFRAGASLEWWLGPDRYDFFGIDAQISKMIADYPNAKIAVFIWCQPGWWYEKYYPERISRQEDGKTVRYYVATATFSDPAYRRDAARAAAELVRHCETFFPGKVVLYNLMGGISCEWQGWNCHTRYFADFGTAARRDFAQYLSAKAPDLADSPVPCGAERSRTADDSTIFRDPVRDRLSMLYDQYYSESIADCITEIAAAVKIACGRRKLVGAYYGYHLEYANLNHRMSGGGHNALYRYLQSKDVDFAMSPQSYGARSVGMPNADMKAFTSVGKYGKFSLHEDDTRTHCTGFAGFNQALNPRQTEAVYRRNIGFSLTHKQPLGHLPLVGGNDLADQAIRRDFSVALKVGQELWEENLPRQAEIAVVIDEQSSRLMAATMRKSRTFLHSGTAYDRDGKLKLPELYVNDVVGELVYYQRIALGQIGAPTDYILLEDAPEAAKKYKLLILLDAFADSEALRKTLAAAWESGTHILAVYGSGFFGSRGVDVNLMSALLGMRFNTLPPGNLQVRYDGSIYGGGYLVRPRFAVADPAARALCRYSDSPDVAAARKGNVTFYAGAQLPAPFLTEVARHANVHIYCDSNDNLEAGCGIISIHSVGRGRKRLRLREPAVLTEIFTGETVRAPDGIAEFPMEALSSKVFRIGKL